MCLLCIEIAKGKMTIKEIGHAIGELDIPQEHAEEFFEVLAERGFTIEELFEAYNMEQLLGMIHDLAQLNFNFFPFYDEE